MIVVIGATGMVGSATVKALRGRGAPVRALVRDPSRAGSIAGRGVDIVQGDLTHPETVEPALRGAEALFLVTPPSPDQVALQRNAIESARKAAVGRVVKLSVDGASRDAPMALGRWHWETEQEIERSGVPFTMLRPTSFMQNLLASAAGIATEGKLYAAMKAGRVPLIDVRDIADVAAVTLTDSGHEGEHYRLTGPEALSYEEIAATISEATGRDVTYVDVPPDAARQGMLHAGLPAWLVEDLLVLNTISIAGKIPVSPAVDAIIGTPGRTFAAFVRDNAGAFGASAGAM